MDVPSTLGKIALFEDLPERQLQRIASIVVPKRFDKGESLFFEGQPATGFYAIGTGRVKVYKLSLEGKEQILHLFGSGEVIGEVPVFAGGRYPAHAEALEPSDLLFIPRDGFIELVKADATLALNMLALLSIRLRQFTHLIENLSLKEVPGRLAAYLLYMSDGSGGGDLVELDISKGQLASLLGTIPETLSRILGKMSQQGLLRVQGRKIALTDREGLQELAQGGKPAP